MNRKYFIICICIVILVSYFIRLNIVNNNINYPKELHFQMGTQVDFGKDFIDSRNNCSNGYSINITGTELIKTDEFLSIYNINCSNSNIESDYVYLICAEFSNNSSLVTDKVGIDLSKILLQETSYISLIDREFISIVNDFDTLKFSLAPLTKKCVVIPFTIDTRQISINRIVKGKPYLVISLYPNKKMISLL